MKKTIKVVLEVFTSILLVVTILISMGIMYYFSMNSKESKAMLEQNYFNIIYKETESGPLKLDIYMPNRKLSPKIPVLVYFHGGSWNSGSKRLKDSDLEIFDVFLEAGFALVSVDYRLTNVTNKFPVHLDDGADSIRWIIKNAETYGLNQNKVNLLGASAGGQMVLMLGMAGDQFGDVDDPTEFKIRSLIDLCGPTDFTDLSDYTPEARKDIDALLLEFFGDTVENMPDQYRLASPMFSIYKDAPPIFMAHGRSDDIIPIGQAEKFYKKAVSVNADVTFVSVENVNHAFQAMGGKEPDPPIKDVLIDMAKFLLMHNIF